MTIYRFGRYVTAMEAYYGDVAVNTQRAYVPNKLTTTIIAYRVGGWIGRNSGSNATARFAVWNTDGGSVPDPDNVLGYTNTATISTAISPGDNNGASYEVDLTTPLLMPSNRYYGIGLTATGAGIGFSEQSAANLSGDNEAIYTKSVGSSVPVNFNAIPGDIEGWMSLWVVGVVNTAPHVPTSLTSGFIASGTTNPILKAAFADDEETLPNSAAWDKLSQVQVQVRRKSDGVAMWTPAVYSATSAEQSAKQSQTTYTGTSLTAGVDYEWRVRHADRAGAWSDWTGWTTFQINPGGAIATSTGTPSGKQTTTTPGPFTGVWSHASSLKAKAVKVQIWSAGDSPTLLMESAAYTLGSQVSVSGTISLTWANTGLSALSKGGSYQYRLSAQDTGNAWSAWTACPFRAFSIDAVPAIPTDLRPRDSQPVSSLPLLSFLTSDADDANANVDGSLTIKRADTTTVSRTATYNATTGRWEYQTTGTDLPSYQTFTWQAKASDGTYDSDYSAWATVVYGQGPTVTVTAPADDATITTGTPTITWTGSGQVSREVKITDTADSSVTVDDSATTATQSFTVPANKLKNGHTYQVQAAITNSVPLTGWSAPITFTLTYTDPDMIQGFAAAPATLNRDTVPSAVYLSWEPTTYAADVFRGCDLWRTAPDGSLLWLRHITNPLQTSFLDAEPVSGALYLYSITQTIAEGLDLMTSPAASDQAQVTISGIVLSDVLNPETYRAHLLSATTPSAPLTQHPLTQNARKLVGLAATKGRTIRSALLSWAPNGKYAIYDTNIASAAQYRDDLTALVAQGHTLCWRDDRGRLYYVSVDNFTVTDRRGGNGYYEIELHTSEEDWRPGEPT